MPTERTSSRLGSEVVDKDGDKKRERRRLEVPSATVVMTELNEESNEFVGKARGESIKLSHPASVPRSKSYFQQDERGTAAQDGRHSGRRETSERGWWKPSKDDEGAMRKAVGSDLHEKDGKSLGRGGDNRVWRHDRFSEVDASGNPPAKRRRQFREEKLPVEPEPEPVKNTASEPRKVPHPISSIAGSKRQDERVRDHRPLERSELDRSYVREKSFSSREWVEKTGTYSRDGFSGYGNSGRYRGRDKFGGRQGFRSGGTGGRVEKWKHDLFDEANRSPSPKNEDDPIAKVEALLSL